MKYFSTNNLAFSATPIQTRHRTSAVVNNSCQGSLFTFLYRCTFAQQVHVALLFLTNRHARGVTWKFGGHAPVSSTKCIQLNKQKMQNSLDKDMLTLECWQWNTTLCQVSQSSGSKIPLCQMSQSPGSKIPLCVKRLNHLAVKCHSVKHLNLLAVKYHSVSSISIFLPHEWHKSWTSCSKPVMFTDWHS